MKRPTFNEKTEVKVISRLSAFSYGKRGTVTAIIGLDENGHELVKPYSPNNYPTRWIVTVKIDDVEYNFYQWENELEVVQHKFVDIDYIREEDLVIGKKEDGTDAIRPKNTGAFEPGDIIQITTKIDGANASIAWDETTGKLEIFSRTNMLTSPGSLRGFYDYIKTEVEPKTDWSKYDGYVFFGEWCVEHSIKSYNKDWFNKWRIYDIWSKTTGCYLSQLTVKDICRELGLEYIEELYYGPFISWDHCRSFIKKSTAYGPDQEGIVVKNQTKLGNPDNRNPAYIKIVDEKFKEAQHSNKPPKVIDPEKVAAHEKAVELIEAVVTEARVKKAICKMIDEGQLPSELQPKDMSTVMKLLPQATFNDIVKEENETVKAVQDLGENIGKLVASTAAKHARSIVVGK